MNIQNILDRVKKTAIKSIWTNGGAPVPVITQNTKKHATWTCALCQLAVDDRSSIDEIIYQIERLKMESKLSYNVQTRSSGERACFVVVCPFENNLRNNLQKLNFQLVYKFPRRNGYDQSMGLLEMWMLSW